MKILELNDITVSFRMYERRFRKRELEVLHRLSLSVREGEIVAVAGSSGSGKSILAHAVLGLLPGNAILSGEMYYMGNPLGEKDKERLRGREIAFIPQSVDYLDPLMKTGRQVQGTRGTKERQRQLFQEYDLGEEAEELYPFQLSGGMARRALLAAAEMEEARLVVADEPTPGLSREMAREALGHFRALADKGCGVLLISHDIDIALAVADKVAIFYAGTIVETAFAKDFQGEGMLRHPYSKAFFAALPQNGFRPTRGSQPYAGRLPDGCVFADRCPARSELCAGEIPMRPLRGGEVKCVHAT